VPDTARVISPARPAISVSGLDVTYRTSVEARPTLKGAIVRLGRPQRSIREIEALKNVSFDVPNGTVLGVIGANGAGKSTLMRAVAGILPPTKGKIEIHGRVSTLLALGVGFNGALTGRQNVVLGSLAAGLTRAQIELKYDEIAEFAELGDFMDMPMRTYSSGMYARLAFAVAVHMEPDILIVDEALSTGDARFKEKSFARMKELCAQAQVRHPGIVQVLDQNTDVARPYFGRAQVDVELRNIPPMRIYRWRKGERLERAGARHERRA